MSEPQEFECASCGRHIILFCGQPGTTECATCQTVPGWHKCPEVARIIDPEYKPEEFPQ